MKSKNTVLILGATGMLGHTLFKTLSRDPALQVYGTARQKEAKAHFSKELAKNILIHADLEDERSLLALLNQVKPNVVINCVGLIKQLSSSQDVLQTIPINSLLPHRLMMFTKKIGARLILISTDCVFSGKEGNYTELDTPDCTDLYGQSKLLGEVIDQSHVLTIRTSIIGHELRGGHSLVNWFLKQKGSASGYTKAIYSGLPTVTLANIIHDLILPNPKLSGLYQIASAPISKYDLLSLIAKTYGKKITLTKTSLPKIDRSLSYAKFKKKTGYKPKPWDQLITEMHDDHQKNY
jgi:dTDP-4-dehydrorhamnose reductase